MDQIILKRVDDAYAFEATDNNGNTARLDASKAAGGNDSGIRPMQSLLMGLGGCGGVDILSILKKQKQAVTDFKMVIEGEREQGKEPSLWKYIHIYFYFSGEVEADRAHKAVSLSLEKYCSVAATLKAAGCTIEWTIKVNE